MAAPTSQNEVTARKLSDTISGLWGKIKDTFSKKAEGVYYVAGTTSYAAWAANTAYAVGDERVSGGKAYSCKTAHTSGSSFDSSKWTALATPILKGSITGITALTTGMKIAYKMPITGGTTSTYLNINNLGNVYIKRNNGNTSTHLSANTVVFLAYDGSAWQWADYDANSTYSGMITAYLNNAGDAAKTATCTNFRLTTGVTLLLANNAANTKADALTLNVNSTGAKPLYINGTASSSSNYTIPQGTFWIHYDGTNWQMYTDGKLPVKELKLTTALSVAQGGTGATDASTARSNLGAAASSHTHGNIQNGGTLQTNDVAIASGDKLVITDSSDSNKVARASISFDGSTATKALTQKGTWETFNNYSHPTTTAADAAAVKVGKDSLGHVVLGSALGKSDVGLGSVVNTGDSATPVSGGTTKFTTGGAYTELAKKADLASPALTGTPTAPTASAGTNTTQIATTAFVKTATTNLLAEADAMLYKGTVAGGSTGSYGALTPAADKGHTYKVTTAGKIDGVAVEVGDMLICNTDSTAAATSSNYSTIAAKWDFVQTNLDGVVIGPSSVTSGTVAAFDGTTGKLIKALTAAQVKSAAGLGNVANTGDSATPVSGGTTKFTTGGAYTELAKKVDVANVSLDNQTTTILAQVQAMAASGIHYSRFYTSGDNSSANISDKPVSGNTGFVCEVICNRYGSSSDWRYQLTCWVQADTNPYVAVVTHSTTAISWARLNTNTTYAFDGTYNASTNKAATVSTVTNAIGALDGTISGSAGSGKTLTAFSQTDGKVSATFGDISITKSQVSDFPTSMIPSSHASTGTGYGAGTTSNYGHVKLATGDMNGAADTTGVAVSKNHTHSQYRLDRRYRADSTNATRYIRVGTFTKLSANSASHLCIGFTARHGDGVVSGELSYKGTYDLSVHNGGEGNPTGSRVRWFYTEDTANSKVSIYMEINAWVTITITDIVNGFTSDTDYSFDWATETALPTGATEIAYRQYASAPLATAVGSAGLPVYSNDLGQLTACTPADMSAGKLIDWNNGSQSVGIGWAKKSISEVKTGNAYQYTGAIDWDNNSNIKSCFLTSIVSQNVNGAITAIVKEVDANNVTVGNATNASNSEKWGNYYISVGTVSSATNTISFMFS